MSAPRVLGRFGWILAIAFPLVTFVVVALAVLMNAQGGWKVLSVPTEGTTSASTQAEMIAKGEYLGRLGNCITCHTTRGGETLAGGRAFVTEWGTLYSSNLTPDKTTGIGAWSLEEFRHVMATGVSRHGALYPAFPFENFQHLNTEDVDAIFAWLQQVPAVKLEVPAHRLSGVAGTRAAMMGWRMAFHRPWELTHIESKSEAWNRGRYLVEGVGHCSMCHGERGSYGTLPAPLRYAGGVIPGQGWYAPALDKEALSRWTVEDLADYLRTGVAPQSSAYGPMAEVIYSSLQYLTPSDANAMAEYLLDGVAPVPARAVRRMMAVPARDTVNIASTRLYETHCAQCHGKQGEGRDRVYPPLANNPNVTAIDPMNLIRVTLFGAAAPTTEANPAPHSMPPFVGRLSDEELLSLINHVRGSWGNNAPTISHTQLNAVRSLPLE